MCARMSSRIATERGCYSCPGRNKCATAVADEATKDANAASGGRTVETSVQRSIHLPTRVTYQWHWPPPPSPLMIFATLSTRLIPITTIPNAMHTYAAHVSQLRRFVKLTKHNGGRM